MPDKWLNLFGRNLSTEVRIDEFTLNVSTACLYASLGWRNKKAAFNDQSGEPECRTCFSSPLELEVGLIRSLRLRDSRHQSPLPGPFDLPSRYNPYGW